MRPADGTSLARRGLAAGAVKEEPWSVARCRASPSEPRWPRSSSRGCRAACRASGIAAAAVRSSRRRSRRPMQAVLDKLAELGPRPIETLTPAEALRQPTPTDAVLALLRERGLQQAPSPLRVEDRSIPGRTGPLPVPASTPRTGSSTASGAGGRGPAGRRLLPRRWVGDRRPRRLRHLGARASRRRTAAIVVSVALRQAPENPFPAATDDALRRLPAGWPAERPGESGATRARVAVAGESESGSLCCRRDTASGPRERGAPLPVHQSTSSNPVIRLRLRHAELPTSSRTRSRSTGP